MNVELSHVPESRFGVWFLSTETWVFHVLERAVADLKRLIGDHRQSYAVILDVGCGSGQSFRLLRELFSPQRMIGVDVNAEMLALSATEVARHNLTVTFLQGESSHLPLADESVDMVFCHQTFHHLVDHESAIREFYRVLKPGGQMLFAESTRAYIHSWMIRLLFRHPMDVQKSAPEYLALIRDAGFDVPETAVSYPYLWWSRKDLGILERFFGIKPSPDREETLLNLVATKLHV